MDRSQNGSKLTLKQKEYNIQKPQVKMTNCYQKVGIRFAGLYFITIASKISQASHVQGTRFLKLIGHAPLNFTTELANTLVCSPVGLV